jgi:manganese/zinc/iron transport system permease protein
MSHWIDHNLAVVLQGASLLGACAGVIGCFAVLRRRSLVGDALSHAALPGVCIAFLIAGEKQFWVLLAGALVAGLAGIVTLALLRRWSRLKEDATISIVRSVFYGAGIVLLSVIQAIPGSARAGLESFILGKTAGLTEGDVRVIMLLSLATLAVVVLCFKEFKLVTFDAEFAQVQGWPSQLIDGLMMLLLVFAVVIGLPAVGVLMMAALLIIPGAAARFWTDRLGVLLIVAGAFGMGAGVLGSFVSASFDKIPAGPSIVLSATLLFLASLAFAPRRGLVARWLNRRRDRVLLQPPAEPQGGA